MLPAEILLMIHELLPPASAACFVLCSRGLLEILGNQSLVYLRLDSHATERRRLLSRLAKDLPDWLLCYRCSVLHPVRSLQLPTERDNHRETAECARADGLIYIRYGFKIRYSHAQLIMRNHRLGRCTKTGLRQLSHVYKADYYNEKSEHTVQGNIVNHDLVITVVSERCFFGRWDFKDIACRAFSICRHIRWVGRDPALLQAFTHRAKPTEETEDPSSQWQYCAKCPTQYCFTVREPKETKLEVRTEVRRNLGSCRTPFEANWSMQIHGLRGKISDTMETEALWTAEARDDVPEGLKVEDNSC